MPVMDGFVATAEIRAHERVAGLKPTKVIALTGLGNVTSQQEAFSCGVDLFLTKPVKLERLRELLAKEDVDERGSTDNT
jgi:CheY-like chemotaxis protein